MVGCMGNSKYNVKPGELALRLHYEAEHSNVLIVTAELLNGCLTACEVQGMEMSLHQYDDKTVSLYVCVLCTLGQWSLSVHGMPCKWSQRVRSLLWLLHSK